MRIIGLFFPAFISISIKHLRNPKHTWQTLMVLVEYGIYVMINVLLTTAIVTYVLNVTGVTVDAFDSFPFFTKYMVIAIMAAVFVPYIEEIIKKYIEIKFKVRINDEEEKERAKRD